MFERTSFLDPPEGIEAVDLERGGAPASLAGFAMAGSEAGPVADLVGVYSRNLEDLLVLDAEGGFAWTSGCSGTARGRGRVIMDDHVVLLLHDDGTVMPLERQGGDLVGEGGVRLKGGVP
jgi:hypothetical protein